MTDISPERMGVFMADAAYEQTKEALDDALDALEMLTDATFVLYHQLEKGFKYDQQKVIVKLALEDAIATLQTRGRSLDACPKCGSTNTETSNWHLSHCLERTPA